MSRMLALLAVTAVAGITTVAVAQAAPTLELDRACYMPGQTMTVTGGGYRPNGDVMVTFGWEGRHGRDSGWIDTRADANGEIFARLDAPGLASSRDLFEDGVALGSNLQREGEPPLDPSNAVSFGLSELAVLNRDWGANRVDPRRRSTFSFRGFQAAGPVVYAHYVRRGRLVKTVRMGATRGPCGDLRVRIRQFPFRPVPAGSYTVVFDGARAWPNSTDGVRWPRIRVPRAKAVR